MGRVKGEQIKNQKLTIINRQSKREDGFRRYQND
jgi:hypothetical protein